MEKDYTSKIKQMRNLAMFKDKSDEEILAWIKKREERQKLEEPEKPVRQPRKQSKDIPTDEELDAEYESMFNEKLEQLRNEYGVDMNNSNDVEMLKQLAQHQIQAEIVNKQIIKFQREPELDTRTLKNLGDYQKGLVATITELQEKLGINRKQRKEKQVDSIPQFVSLVRKRASEVWQRSTTPVRCENCQIELARYWLNFPNLESDISMKLQCWKCNELVVYKK